MVYTVHGILQARILEWVAFPFSRGSPQPRDRICVPCISCTAGSFFTGDLCLLFLQFILFRFQAEMELAMRVESTNCNQRL